MLISELQEEFIKYKIVEDEIADETVTKYNDCLKRFVALENDLNLEEINLSHFLDLKFKLKEENISNARISSIIFCMRSLLRYSSEIKNLDVISPNLIKPPKRIKKEIVYLTNEEIAIFLNTIDTSNLNGLRMRTLCEVLLDTGARISEALSLNRDSIKKENDTYYALIVGKGNKQRRIYFSDRGLKWTNLYLNKRRDNNIPIFINHINHERLKRDTLWRDFHKISKLSGINKNVTPHILRHTFCTNLLINGCGIAYIQKLAGHEDINTTIRHYANLNNSAIVKARREFLNYN